MEIISSKLRSPNGQPQLEEAVPQIKMPGQDSQLKQAAEALRRENERIEAENRKKDKEIADLLKKIQNAKR